MRDDVTEGLANREAQWDAFHRWESTGRPQSISVEERIAWYLAAFDFNSILPKRSSVEDIRSRVRLIQNMRESLAYLK